MMAAREELQWLKEAEDFKVDIHVEEIKIEPLAGIKDELEEGTCHLNAEDKDHNEQEDILEIKEEPVGVLNDTEVKMEIEEEDIESSLFDRSEGFRESTSIGDKDHERRNSVGLNSFLYSDPVQQSSQTGTALPWKDCSVSYSSPTYLQIGQIHCRSRNYSPDKIIQQGCISNNVICRLADNAKKTVKIGLADKIQQQLSNVPITYEKLDPILVPTSSKIHYGLNLQDETKNSHCLSQSLRDDKDNLEAGCSYTEQHCQNGKGKITFKKPNLSIKESRCHSNENLKQFSQFETLHKNLQTDSEKFSLSCDECGKTFSHSRYLRRHLRRHLRKQSGEKPYCCNECGKGFRELGNLKEHLSIHSGIIPFKCNECKKTFIRSSYLRTHLKYHDIERPFSCNECRMRYFDRGVLLRHLRLHIDKNPLDAEEATKQLANFYSDINTYTTVHSA